MPFKFIGSQGLLAFVAFIVIVVMAGRAKTLSVPAVQLLLVGSFFVLVSVGYIVLYIEKTRRELLAAQKPGPPK